MPVHKVGDKWAIGRGKPIYDTKKKALRAYSGYLGSKYIKKVQGGNMDQSLSFFVPINKLDEEQRMVYGIATNPGVDRQNEIVDWEATKDALVDYSNWRNIREMHKPSAVGTAPILELRDDKQELFIGAKIIDDQAWQKCKEGVYKGFSIGGEVLDRKIEFNKASNKTINRVTKYMMNEISIVDRPANPSCKFQTLKRDTTIETITITEDPLKMESARVMEKAILLAKKVLSGSELNNLPDELFGLIKVVSDGDKLIKHRLFPMPDNVHAINMIRKMSGSDELTDAEKEIIHQKALEVLGKKHVETECPYCINSKLKGGVPVKKDIKKQEITAELEEKKKIEDEKLEEVAADAIAPETATDSIKEAQKEEPKIVVDEEPAEVDAVSTGLEAKIDRVLTILEDLLGIEEKEQAEEIVEEPVKEDIATEEPIEEEKKEEITEEVKDVDAEEVEEEDEEKVDECAKSQKKVVAPKKSLNKGLLLNKVRAIVEPLARENKELKARISKMEQEPLPRKDALNKSDNKATKIEKYQDVKLEKRESAFSEGLVSDIDKAQSLRKSGKALNSEEDAFCKRVAERMLDEKLSK